MKHVQILNGVVVCVFANPQPCEGYEVVANDDARLLAFYAPKVPHEVTMRQARLALAGVGLLDAVNKAIAEITDPATRKAAQIEWEYSATVQRDRQFVALLAPALGLSDQMLDQLFIAAAAL